MFASLHGSGNLTELAFEFSPVVEQSAAGTELKAINNVPQAIHTVTFDVSGLDRLFGMVQDIAAAIARRARETGVQANLALAANADAAILAARGFSGTSILRLQPGSGRERGQISGSPAARPAIAFTRITGNTRAVGHTTVSGVGHAAAPGNCRAPGT